LIVGVNNVDVSRISDPELAAAFAGFNSGTLKLKVMSPSGTKNIVLRRATMVMADADIIWRRGTNTEKQDEGGILEIILYNISENAVSIVNEALAKHSDASGIILDLRVARGGDERAAAKLAGLFLGRAPVMRIDEGNGEEVEVIPGGDAATGASVVVLVSGETTGSAEGVAMAFFEARRGVLAGTPTAGFARLVTKIELSGGGVIELGNRIIKSGRGAVIDGRGVFPLVCLSNIRNNSQQDVFFVNVVNGDFNAKDFNSDSSVNAADVRKGCSAIKSGADEDSVAAAVSMKLLTDKTAYESLIKNVSE
jgi:C-terminal processing protease CtpA/Prc